MRHTTAKFVNSRAQVVSLLREHGITPTDQRVKIGEVLFVRPQHVSAEHVMSLVNESGEQVSKATVYNTLGLFAEKGLLREVIIDPAKVFYDTNLDKRHHIYHIGSGILEDIRAEQVEISRLPELPRDTILEDVDVIIRVRANTNN